MSDIKRCGACQQVKVKADFARHPQNRDGRQGTCRTCQAAATPVRRHGLTRLDKAKVAEGQGGCLICRTVNPGSKGWVVDHDHSCCGPVRSCDVCRRGVLCGRCNTALGMANDDPTILRRMAAYLDAHRLARLSRSSDQVSDQSTDSLSGIALTDGRTHEEVTNPPLKTEPSVTRTHVRRDRQTGTDSGAARPSSSVWTKCAYCSALNSQTPCCPRCERDPHARCPSWPSCTRPGYGKCDASALLRSLTVDQIRRILTFTDWRRCTDEEVEGVAVRLLEQVEAVLADA